MRKEIFFAIFAGGTFGLIIAFGIWRLTATKPKDNITSKSISTNSPTPTEVSDFKIILTKPNPMEVLTDSPTVVAGLTKPNTWVVVSGEDSDDIINASDSGSFNSNVTLEGGVNQIKINAFDSDGSKAETKILAIYSSSYIPPATNSASISYIGVVTDVTNSIIQIKNEAGDIEQIKGTTDANYIDTRNNATKQISSTDVAIGDYLIAMGVKDGNNILDSSRILVTDSLKDTTREAFFGIVTDDTGINKFVAKDIKTNQIITVTPASGVTVTGGETSFGKISNDEKIIAAGELKDRTLTARTILVLTK